MSTIINQDFLLYSEAAKRLYHDYAKNEPIIDYHCHLPPDELANDIQFNDLTHIWLNGDHYKWRAMRANGVNEKYITGDANPKEKFMKWAETVPYTVRNPLFHWTHLELKRYFDIDEYLNPKSAEAIWEACNAKLATKEFSARNIPKNRHVEVICTTDDPIDDLSHHQKMITDGYSVKVRPAFRPDNAIKIEQPQQYVNYLQQLSRVSDINIQSLKDLLEALQKRIAYFHANGCRLSDHGLNQIPLGKPDEAAAAKTFEKALAQQPVSAEEIDQFKLQVLVALGKMYHEKGWIQQFHVGALRDNNKRLLSKVGADVGVDSIGDFPQAISLSHYFNLLDQANALTKTILYNLNPADNEIFATMIGNFQDGSVAGKMQFGSGWWFLDQKNGMESQMEALSNMGLISQFVGMLTDSRSFLSYPRHEYFRRVLCNLFGNDIEKGELPADYDWIGGIVKNICYQNARDYFDFH